MTYACGGRFLFGLVALVGCGKRTGWQGDGYIPMGAPWTYIHSVFRTAAEMLVAAILSSLSAICPVGRT